MAESDSCDRGLIIQSLKYFPSDPLQNKITCPQLCNVKHPPSSPAMLSLPPDLPVHYPECSGPSHHLLLESKLEARESVNGKEEMDARDAREENQQAW